MTPREWLFPKTPSLGFLEERMREEPPFRIVSFGLTLLPNINLIYRLESVEGYYSFHSARYHRFMKELVSPDVHHNWVDIFSRANKKLLRMLNVKYILTKNKIEEDLELVYDGEIKIYEDPKALPRAWIVPQAKVLKTKEEIFKELKNPGFDPRKVVIVEEKVKWKKGGSFNSQIPTIITYQPERIVIDAELHEDGFLVLSDSWDPGWKVFVNGKRRKILRANYIMRAVYLEKGKHRVEFLYDPFCFKLGLYISGTTFIVGILLGLYSLFRAKRREG
jgi:hypothetical protein